MFERFKRNIQPIVNIYHLVKAVLANAKYGFPSKKIKVIGVTGTDGKTTTASLIYHILKSAGNKVSLISTVYAKIGQKEYDTGLHTTTPDALQVQRMLQEAVKNGDEYMILEVTSHALDQNRTYGITFEVGVVTNITHEHLDYHKTYSNYVKSKVKLLLNSNLSIINADDDSYKRLRPILKKYHKQYQTYGLKNQADYDAHLSFIESDFYQKLPDFNKSNYLAAYGVVKHLGVTDDTYLQAIKSFSLPPGRVEVVYKNSFTAIIDFAHTPNSLRSILPAVKKLYLKDNARLIHVFGAAGLRDSSKRMAMGQASGKYSSIVILTEEDYRTEDPQEIATQIAYGLIKQGFQLSKKQLLKEVKKKAYSIILNRSEAIKTAISIARPGDVVIMTGKSHEQSLCRGTVEMPWDEKKAVMRAIKQRKK